MKLGNETGSLVNHMMGNVEKKMPEAGDPATILMWSDRNPATVVEVFKKGKFDYFVIQEDFYKRIDKNGFSETQEYEYAPNPEGYKQVYRFKNGEYEAVKINENGRYVKMGCSGLMIGKRQRYCDPCF